MTTSLEEEVILFPKNPSDPKVQFGASTYSAPLIGARDKSLWIEIINDSDKTVIGRIEKEFDFCDITSALEFIQ